MNNDLEDVISNLEKYYNTMQDVDIDVECSILEIINLAKYVQKLNQRVLELEDICDDLNKYRTNE